MNRKAEMLLARGNRLLDRNNYAGAERQFRKATQLAPDWSIPWFNLGLVYKHTQTWEQSFTCNQKATQLDPADEAGWWNLGIAATALKKWDVARAAWTVFGVPVPKGSGPLEMKLGLTPIRLNPDTSAEVVWCDRIDPARAIIRNIPLPDSGHRYGDVMLHDGAPRGYRKHGNQEVPVFDALALFEASPYSTYEVVVEAAYPTDRDDLLNLAQKHRLEIEDWSTIRMLCHLCSLGKPHEKHEPQEKEEGPLVRYGIAARDEAQVEALLNEWKAERLGCLILSVECVVEGHET